MLIFANKILWEGIFDNEKFKKVLNYFLQNGCKYVILGCTELSGFKKDFDKNTIDPMDYLVKAAILSVDKEYKD